MAAARLSDPWGGLVAEFVWFALEDGSEVVFESAESDLAALHGREPDMRDGGRLQTRLESVAAAEQLLVRCGPGWRPDEVALKCGLEVSGEVNWWFFAKNQAEGIQAMLIWRVIQNSTVKIANGPLTCADVGRGGADKGLLNNPHGN